MSSASCLELDSDEEPRQVLGHEKPLKFVIPACDGKSTFLFPKPMRRVHIDPHFESWKPGNEWGPTKKTALSAYPLEKKATLEEMFYSFGVDLGKLCLTPHQIRKFRHEDPKGFAPGGTRTAFLVRNNKNFFVVMEYADMGGVHLIQHRFRLPSRWDPRHNLRVVIPRIK